MSDVRDGPILLFGGGRMGGALLAGWLRSGIDPGLISVFEPDPTDELMQLQVRYRFGINPEPRQAEGQTIVLAVKPQRAADLVAPLARIATARSLAISIMAGKTTATLTALYPGIGAFVRAMPNLPVSVGQGAIAAFADPRVDEALRSRADGLLAGAGAVEWLADEGLLDAVTGLSGSGPAYIFYLTECMARAGVAAGLPADVAERLAMRTVVGSGELLRQSPKSPEALRRDVTSPAGTTAEGLKVLMQDDALLAMMIEVVAAATRRSRELAQ